MTRPNAKPYEWTYAEYARFPDDGNRYEVIDGEVLVTPAPSTRHQHIAGNLYIRLREHVERHDLGFVLFDVDLLFQTGQFLRPDLVYVPKSGRAGLSDRGVEVAPGLIVEVLSPSSGSIDKVKKPARYGDFGVPEYWVADPDEAVVWVYDFRRGGEAVREDERVVWRPEPAAPALEIELADIFAPL